MSQKLINKMMLQAVIISLFYLILVTPASYGKSHEDELRHELMDGYNPAALPSKTVRTRISFTVLNFDLDEPNQAMDINLWVHMNWFEPRLEWRSKGKFFTIKKLAFPADSVWKPDITLYNHAEPRSADPYVRTQVLVKSNGNMTWVPPAQIKATCSMDMTYWPRDVHNCSLHFGSWVHSINTIDLYPMKDAIMSVEKTKRFTRGEWKVTDSGINRFVKLYSCCPEKYVSIKAWLIIERIAPAYVWIVQAPAVVLGIFTFIIFLLPPSATEKIIFGGFTLILDFYFLMKILHISNYTSDKTPLIVKYISKQVILTSVALMVSVIAIHITRSNYNYSLPASLKKALNVLSRILYVRGPKDMDTVTQAGSSNAEAKGMANKDAFLAISPSETSDWILLALVVDRLCLLLFAVIFFVNLILYCSVL